MRNTLAVLTIFAMLFLAACGGSKKTDMPEPDPFEQPQQTDTAGETPTTVMPEEDLGEDEDVNFQPGDRLGETPISDMTLEEINAAEFLKNVFFEFDKFDLTDTAVSQLEQNGRWLLDNSSVKVIIEGHCDERGTEEYNLALGERRSNSARSFLVRMGIASDRLMTASYGESRPLDPRSSEEAWAKNRRAHFRIYSK